MHILKYTTLSLLAFCSLLRSEEVELSQTQANVSNLLNLAQVSIQTIATYNNRLILDREYDSIINNFNLREIPDAKLVELLNELLDALLVAKLTDRERAQIALELERSVKDARRVATTETASNLVSVAVQLGKQDYLNAFNSGVSAASNYWDYQKKLEQFDRAKVDKNWTIDNQVLEDINQINKRLLTLSWELYNKYNIPDYRRLTSEDIKSLIAVGRQSNTAKRFRQLNQDHLKKKFGFYAPYWYYLGLAAHQMYHINSDPVYKKLGLRAYERYTELAFAILKKDEMLISSKLGRLQLLDPKIDRVEILENLAWLNENPPKDWSEITTLAISFEKSGDNENAVRWAQYNVDREEVNKLFHRQVLARIQLNIGAHSVANQTISNMLELKGAKIVDILQMMGEENMEVVAGRLEPVTSKISLELNARALLADILTLKVPQSLYVKEGEVALQLLGKTVFDPNTGRVVMRNGSRVLPKKVRFDTLNDLVLFEFIEQDIDRFIEDGYRDLLVNFISEACPVSILYVAEPAEEAVIFNKKWISIDKLTYAINQDGLVNANAELEQKFHASAKGFLYEYALRNGSLVSLAAFDASKTLKELFQSGKNSAVQEYYFRAIKDDSLSYWNILASLGKHKAVRSKLDQLPLADLRFFVNEGLGQKIKAFGKSAEDGDKFFGLAGKVIQSETVSENLKTLADLELPLGDRWKAPELYAFKLTINDVEFEGKHRFSTHFSEPSVVSFKDCFSLESWSEASIESFAMEVKAPDFKARLVFTCPRGEITKATLSQIKLQ